MKLFRWICAIFLLFFIFRCLYNFPFVKESYIFILPEVNLSMSIVKDNSVQFGLMEDIRPDYIQTERNFSNYHSVDLTQFASLLLMFEEEIKHMGSSIVNSQPLLNHKKTEIKVTKPVVWPRYPLKPIKISTKNSLLGSSKDAFIYEND